MIIPATMSTISSIVCVVIVVISVWRRRDGDDVLKEAGDDGETAAEEAEC